MRGGAIVGLLGAVGINGCAGGGGAGDELASVRNADQAQVLPGGGAVVAGHPFEAARVQIHPLTRLLVDPVAGSPRVDAHVELFDEFGQPTRSLGTFVFELYLGSASSRDGLQQLRVWDIPVEDRAANAQRFDRVTRTYRFPLGSIPAEILDGDGLTLRVQFRALDGTILRATAGL